MTRQLIKGILAECWRVCEACLALDCGMGGSFNLTILLTLPQVAYSSRLLACTNILSLTVIGGGNGYNTGIRPNTVGDCSNIDGVDVSRVEVGDREGSGAGS